MELRCEGDSRGTLFRVRFFGFARTSAAAASATALLALVLLSLLLLLAAAEFLRGFAIVLLCA